MSGGQSLMIFDDVARDSLDSRGEAEPLFAYYNASARNDVAALRDLLQTWFDRLPDQARTAMHSRLRSPDDISFQSAFFELYLHELLRCMGYDVEYEPDVPGTSKRPDFLVKRERRPYVYLEATVAAASKGDQAEQKRAGVVYDTLNEMDSPDFFLSVEVEGVPASPPKGAKLRADLQAWLATLDAAELETVIQEQGFDALPTWEWSHGDWRLVFQAIPKSPEHRGGPGVRPIGATVGPAQFTDSQSAIRSAMKKKATKYGDLDLPLVVAINALDEYACDDDMMGALFGEECLVAPVYRDGRSGEVRETRKGDGAWRGPTGPRGRNVSAAIIAYRLDPWRVAAESPRLIHHPWARRPLAYDLWPFDQWAPDNETGQFETRPGKAATEVLHLPSPWPPEDD